MHYHELLKSLEVSFIDLGFRKIADNLWGCELYDLIIVLTIRELTLDKQFSIGMGLIINDIGTDAPLREIVFDYDTHVCQTWFGILALMGESEENLDQLFSYTPDDKTGFEMKNISILTNYYKNKIIPHIKGLDVYTETVSNFDKKSAWEPFMKYFVPNQYNEPFMKRFDFFLSMLRFV